MEVEKTPVAACFNLCLPPSSPSLSLPLPHRAHSSLFDPPSLSLSLSPSPILPPPSPILPPLSSLSPSPILPPPSPILPLPLPYPPSPILPPPSPILPLPLPYPPSPPPLSSLFFPPSPTLPSFPGMPASPPLQIHRHLTGSGHEWGGLTTEISNLAEEEVEVLYLDMVPWFCRVYLHTLAVSGGGSECGSGSWDDVCAHRGRGVVVEG